MTHHEATSEVLNRAADLIEQRGWTTGDQGWPGFDEALDPATSPLCLEGAIIAALGWDATSGGISDVDTCPAGRAVKEYLDKGGYLFLWNDSPDRTAEDVIATLRAVALIEAAKEQAEVSA